MKNFLMSPHYNFKFVAQIIIKVLCAEQHTRPQTCTHTQTQTDIECGIQMPQSFQSQFLPHAHTDTHKQESHR